MLNFHEDTCIYSVYSLQFYLILPTVKLAHSLSIPNLVAFFIAISGPTFLLDRFIKSFANTNYITLVKHQPAPDHQHSSQITRGVLLRSAVLGVILTIGISFVDSSLQSHFVPLGFYLILLSFFHFSEYFVTSLTNPSTLNLGSFLIDQSMAYTAAILGSFLEYGLETYFLPGFKKFNVIALVGLLLAVSGEFIRKLAMFTAGKNFTHAISFRKSPDHQLVTHGIYSYLRHPSYTGWFYWAIGSQILLLNPICAIMFFILSRKFFKDRVMYEEETLVRFFGTAYEDYRKTAHLWMPIK